MLLAHPQAQVAEYIASMEKKRLREGIRLVMSISADGNKFLQARACLRTRVCLAFEAGSLSYGTVCKPK